MMLLAPSFAPPSRPHRRPTGRSGPWTDLYSLAAVVKYCISGELPPPASLFTPPPHEPMASLVMRLRETFPQPALQRLVPGRHRRRAGGAAARASARRGPVAGPARQPSAAGAGISPSRIRPRSTGASRAKKTARWARSTRRPRRRRCRKRTLAPRAGAGGARPGAGARVRSVEPAPPPSSTSRSRRRRGHRRSRRPKAASRRSRRRGAAAVDIPVEPLIAEPTLPLPPRREPAIERPPPLLRDDDTAGRPARRARRRRCSAYAENARRTPPPLGPGRRAAGRGGSRHGRLDARPAAAVDAGAVRLRPGGASGRADGQRAGGARRRRSSRPPATPPARSARGHRGSAAAAGADRRRRRRTVDRRRASFGLNGSGTAAAPEATTVAAAADAAGRGRRRRRTAAPRRPRRVVTTAAAPASHRPPPAAGNGASRTAAAPPKAAAPAVTKAALPERSVARSPREACGNRTQFSLYRCMQTQCAQDRWTQHRCASGCGRATKWNNAQREAGVAPLLFQPRQLRPDRLADGDLRIGEAVGLARLFLAPLDHRAGGGMGRLERPGLGAAARRTARARSTSARSRGRSHRRCARHRPPS